MEIQFQKKLLEGQRAIEETARKKAEEDNQTSNYRDEENQCKTIVAQTTPQYKRRTHEWRD